MSVLVYTENRDGKFRKPIFELISYASALAEMMKTSVTAISIGQVDESELKKLGAYGAGKVITVAGDAFKTFDSQSYTALIAEVASATGAGVVMLANNNTGRHLHPVCLSDLRQGLPRV